MTGITLALGLAVVASTQPAEAASCCGSGPPVDPGVLGPEERVGVSIGLSAAATPSRWGSDGKLSTSGGGEVGPAIGARARATRWFQAGVVLPAAVRATDDGVHVGLSDVVALARIEPPSTVTGKLHPALAAGGVAPTGWRPDDLPPWWRVLVVPAVELTWDGAAASAFGSLSLPVWAPGAPAIRPGATWQVGAAAGPHGEWGSLAFGAGARGTTVGRIDGTPAGAAEVSPVLRGSAAARLTDDARVVIVAEGGPPVPYLGRNADLGFAVGGSLLRTW